MHRIHPEIENFAKYCYESGIDVRELAQQYADNNPLSYGDHLMAHFCSDDIVSYAEQLGWDISEHPEVVLQIASEISRYADAEYGINWEFLDYHIREVFESAPPDLKALARGGNLDGYLEHPSSLFTPEEREELGRRAEEEALDPTEKMRQEIESLKARIEEMESED